MRKPARLFGLTEDEISAIREKAAVFVAKQQGVLPVNQHGYVLAEYRRHKRMAIWAPKSACSTVPQMVYLCPLAQPMWQFTIQVRLPRLGVLGLMGTLDVDAKTGEVIPLTNKQIKRIREHADALVEFQTQPTTA